MLNVKCWSIEYLLFEHFSKKSFFSLIGEFQTTKCYQCVNKQFQQAFKGQLSPFIDKRLSIDDIK